MGRRPASPLDRSAGRLQVPLTELARHRYTVSGKALPGNGDVWKDNTGSSPVAPITATPGHKPYSRLRGPSRGLSCVKFGQVWNGFGTVGEEVPRDVAGRGDPGR